MSLTVPFTVIMVLVLLRILWLRLKSASMHSENFKQLPPKDQLAVLKECLLNNPTEYNLQNLKDFTGKQGLDLDAESYRPFLKKQLELSKRKDALAEDNELFSEEARWLDLIRPFEFNEAEVARRENRQDDFLTLSVEGIARLYSDDAILDELDKLVQDYPKAIELSESYRKLMKMRDESAADDDSLDKLRRAKQAWEKDLLQVDFPDA